MCPPATSRRNNFLFLIQCVEMRSTDSRWEPSQRRQEDEEEPTATQETERCPSTSTQSPTPDSFEPPAPNSSPPAAPPSTHTALGPGRRQTLFRPRRQRTERDEDRLIDLLQGMCHPAPQLSSEAFFLLSLEEKMNKVPSAWQTELRYRLMNIIDSFIPQSGSRDQANPPLPALSHFNANRPHPWQHTIPETTHMHPCSTHTTQKHGTHAQPSP